MWKDIYMLQLFCPSFKAWAPLALSGRVEHSLDAAQQ